MSLKEKTEVKPVDPETVAEADKAVSGELVQEDHATTELATVTDPLPPSVPTAAGAGNAIVKAIAKLREKFGDDALEFDFTSFPILKLEKRNFELSNDERVGDDLKVVIAEMKVKYLYQSTHAEQKDREVVYSYDKNAHINDPDTVETIRKWKEEAGVDFTIKKYLEVLAFMLDDDRDHKMDNQIVMLQIPPKSIAKLSGYLTSQEASGREIGSYVTIISAGKEVGHGQTAFYPWEFKFDRMLS